MNIDDFDYPLPEELIAQEPLPQRDASRLLVLDRSAEGFSHRTFTDLPELLRPGDLLVVNDAKVIPARLIGRKVATGGKVELVLTLPLGDPGGTTWRCIGQASKAIRPGMLLDFDGLEAEVLAAPGDGAYDVRFDSQSLQADLERVGRVPLPPYIHREATGADRDRYQTIFARKPGAAAAPTAGLHFTEHLLGELERRGIQRAKITLYVGAGTFLPVRTHEVEKHHMHAERFSVPAETVEAIARTKRVGGRVVAVGTTAARALESASATGELHAGDGVSELFIYPGFQFHVIDALVTNFHLPKSTLLLLVSALAGWDRIHAAYLEAVERRYRFFSYGDAMLIL
jgi:S-adenosylmethionine:tRNA ribosyltransferase-isomerase